VATGLERFEEMRERLAELEAAPPAQGDPNLASYYQERGRIEKALRPYLDYVKLVEDRREAESVAGDESQEDEFRELAREEVEKLRARGKEMRKDLLVRLVSMEGADRPTAIFEIRAGTGGEEAALFCADLFRMYRRHTEKKGWRMEVLDDSPTGLGGFKEVVFRVEGEGAFARLRFEGGTHRVQRVPKTESQGRIHTSAATVAVMSEPEPIELEIPESDIERTFIHSQGPGGQSVNTTDSAVRLVHKPTGITVKCQIHKSQRQNRIAAMKILRARLLVQKEEEAQLARSENRKSQIGSGDRSGRVRTYNFPQNRVTDHRLSGDKNFSLAKLIDGDLDGLIDRLIEQAATGGAA
jgi:peptide chain release factor 1